MLTSQYLFLLCIYLYIIELCFFRAAALEAFSVADRPLSEDLSMLDDRGIEQWAAEGEEEEAGAAERGRGAAPAGGGGALGALRSDNPGGVPPAAAKRCVSLCVYVYRCILNNVYNISVLYFSCTQSAGQYE
jgi:hypothetical protein